MDNRCKFGLLGKNISYSFSRKYFSEKFLKLGLNDYKYFNFDIPEIEEFPFLLYHKEDEFRGLNVTIPYKESVMRYLDEVDIDAKKIGAVNTIKVTDDNKLIGYNTDFYGFKESKETIKVNQRRHTNSINWLIGVVILMSTIYMVYPKFKSN